MSSDLLFIADKKNSILEQPVDSTLITQHQQDPNSHTIYGIEDRIRFLTGNFWVRSSQEDVLNAQSYTLYRKGSNARLTDVFGWMNLVSEETHGNGHVQRFKITQRALSLGQAEMLFRDWFESQGGDTFYTDHSTTINMYEPSPNQEESSRGVLDLYCTVKSEYNYLQVAYERKVSEQRVVEPRLPNFYNIMMRRLGSSFVVSLGGRIPYPDSAEVPFAPNNEYFENWSRYYDDYYSEPYMRGSSRSYFEEDVVLNMGDLYQERNLFPMFTTIEFNTDNKSEIGNILEETHFTNQLELQMLRSSPSIRQTSEIRIKNKISTLEGAESDLESTESVSSTSRKFYDINNLFQEYEFEQIDESIYFDESIVGARHFGVSQENRAYFHLMALIVQGRIQKLKKEKYRKYSEIINGQVSYSEPVMYFLEKRDEESGDLLQTFVFNNTTKTDIIKYVDTQVKYDKKYAYKLKSWNAVIGTKYRYELESFDTRLSQFKVYSEPHIILTEVDLSESSTVVLDSPPVNPEVEIIPIVGKNDKVRIHLNSSPGRFTKKPIIFSNDEFLAVNRLRQAQDLNDKTGDGPIIFESDDNIDRFIAYRTDFLPSNYRQFYLYGKKKEVATGNQFIESVTGEDTRTNSSAYIDDVVPNKKYYYCFRAVDVHGNHSYPSDVYELEIVDDHGSVYPIIKVCDLSPPDTRQATKSFKRFMYLSPSLSNVIPNEFKMGIYFGQPGSGPDLGQRVELGVNTDSVWEKRFKIRLRSKTTGRTSDFYFTFNHEQKYLESDSE